MPSFSITPARITDPAVGASVWASGSHVCTGMSGTFTAKPSANARKIQRAVVVARDCACAISTTSKVSGPPVAEACRNAVARMPTSINAEPNIVNRKNLTAE